MHEPRSGDEYCRSTGDATGKNSFPVALAREDDHKDDREDREDPPQPDPAAPAPRPSLGRLRLRPAWWLLGKQTLYVGSTRAN